MVGGGGSGGYAGFVSFGQGAYSWTDKVYITVVAPDYNFDSRAVDSIGRHGTRLDKDLDQGGRPERVQTGRDRSRHGHIHRGGHPDRL